MILVDIGSTEHDGDGTTEWRSGIERGRERQIWQVV